MKTSKRLLDVCMKTSKRLLDVCMKTSKLMKWRTSGTELDKT
jgi:hypothetical protein